MKKFISALLVVCLVACLFTGCGKKEDTTTIYVYNWGQYIAEGDDDSIDVIAEFEKKYPNIKVQYSTFDSNETMYAKLKNGGITVDVVFPSDYMIGRMRQEGMLLELNYDNIPNAKYIDDSYRGLAFDPEDKFSVPYTWGTVGIIYNSKFVDEADVTGWELLWNEKYAGKILMFDNLLGFGQGASVSMTNVIDPLPLGAELVLPVMLFVYKDMSTIGRTYVFTGCTVIAKDYGELNAEKSELVVDTITIAFREMICLDTT